MKYLLDTSTFSDLVREHVRVRARLAALTAADTVLVSVVTRGEILYGIEKMAPGKKRDELAIKANGFLTAFPCEPLQASTSDAYARTKVLREKAGMRLEENDLWIAATALALGATLVTRDADFRNTPGLAIEDWTA